MKLPTIKQFNQWSLESKQIWLNDDTGGVFSDPHVPGFIVYDKAGLVIKYKVDEKRKLLEAQAMTLAEGLKAFKIFVIAAEALDMDEN